MKEQSIKIVDMVVPYSGFGMNLSLSENPKFYKYIQFCDGGIHTISPHGDYFNTIIPRAFKLSLIVSRF